MSGSVYEEQLILTRLVNYICRGVEKAFTVSVNNVKVQITSFDDDERLISPPI